MRWDGGVFLMALSGEIRRRRGIRIGLAHAGEKPGERDFRSPLLFPPPVLPQNFCLGEGPPVAEKKWREEIPTKNVGALSELGGDRAVFCARCTELASHLAWPRV